MRLSAAESLGICYTSRFQGHGIHVGVGAGRHPGSPSCCSAVSPTWTSSKGHVFLISGSPGLTACGLTRKAHRSLQERTSWSWGRGGFIHDHRFPQRRERAPGEEAGARGECQVPSQAWSGAGQLQAKDSQARSHQSSEDSGKGCPQRLRGSVGFRLPAGRTRGCSVAEASRPLLLCHSSPGKPIQIQNVILLPRMTPGPSTVFPFVYREGGHII